MRKRFLPLFAAAICTVLMGTTQVLALNNGLARTPPMGFNTWNWFGCKNSSGHGYVTDTMMLQIAAAFKTKGMAAVGYQYVNIDDCYAAMTRNASGGLVPLKQFFPRGLRWLTDSIHRMGLKAGAYSDIGSLTCMGCFGGNGFPGMQGGFEQQDCDSFVAWGFDYLKVDICCFQGLDNTKLTIEAYARVRDALDKAVTRMKPKVPDAHKMVFSICSVGLNTPWLWGDSIGNQWRTTSDIGWQWNSMMNIVDKNEPLYPYARIGSWNDPDMLEIGNGDFGSDLAKNRSHMSLYAIMASPLIAGNDIRNMSAGLQAIMTNKEVIDVDQDTLGGDTTKGKIQGRRVVSGNSEVWVKLLKGKKNTEYAVLFFNRSNTAAVNISVTTQQIASMGGDMANGKTYKVRDLWGHADKGTWTAGQNLSTPAAVPVTDVYMVRLSQEVPTQYPLASMKVFDMRVLSEDGKVTVHSDRSGPLSIRMVNLKGEAVYSKRHTGPVDYGISTKALPRGLYIVNVQNVMERLDKKVYLAGN